MEELGEKKEVKVRCPYCRRVFLFKYDIKNDGARTKNSICPYCDAKVILSIAMRK